VIFKKGIPASKENNGPKASKRVEGEKTGCDSGLSTRKKGHTHGSVTFSKRNEKF